MKRFIDTYDGRPFDVVVVGGGISGAAVAYDAASRGLSVALLEKRDFGGATSAATSKLIHGGIRYLENREFSMVRQSLRERRTMSNIAPNLVYPQPVMVTIYGRASLFTSWAFRAGLTIYDLLSFDKRFTWRISCP
jgi:glycerol-3-phosphate dehydrogenase